MKTSPRDAIIEALRRHGGKVYSSTGYAMTTLTETVQEIRDDGITQAGVRQLVKAMEADGLLTRDTRSTRTYEVSLAPSGGEGDRVFRSFREYEEAVKPVTPKPDSILERLRSVLVEVAAELEPEPEPDTSSRDLELAREQVRGQQSELQSLRRDLKQEREKVAELTSDLDQRRSEVEELREALRISNHNADVWRSKASRVGNAVQETFTTVKAHLTSDERRHLDHLMRQLPEG